MDRHQTYDYIIAGAGSAGCALAARLCEDPDITVCLIEAGDDGNSLFVRMPAGNGFIFGHHPVSTCRIGADDDVQAVLDAEFRVRGIEGLRVVDASAFPDQLSGNPNAAVIMMAERAADMLLGRPQPDPAQI